jgi:nitroreductase
LSQPASASVSILDAIRQRRSASAKFLIEPAPTAEALERMVLALSRAPDHGRLVPFRLIQIENAARAAFADIIEAAHVAAQPDLSPHERERSREKATQGPLLLALVARIDAEHIKIPTSDQWLTVGAALENFLFAAQAEGFGVAIRSGRYLEQAPLRQAFGLDPREEVVSLLAVGTVGEWPPEKPKPTLEQVFSRWNGAR